MDTAIRIEAPVVDGTLQGYVAGAIAEIFQAGFETRQSESVMLKALDVLGRSTDMATKNINISGCNLQDDSVNR